MQEIRVALFVMSTPASRELAGLLEKIFEFELIEGKKVSMKTFIDSDDGEMMAAGLRDDVVIFDASIEDNKGLNYKVTRMWPLCMDHFLVVSRTRLPINFIPYHEGGSPGSWGNTLDRPFSLSNSEISNWVKEQIKLLSNRLPRPENERISSFSVSDFNNISRMKEVGELVQFLISESIKRRYTYLKGRGKVFVSYLSAYSKYHKNSEKYNGFYVEDVISYIKKQKRDNYYPILYYPPGSLSGEFMVEYRRWQVVRMIEERIRASDEFWIFETEDYYNSWWTKAELAILAYIQHSDEHPILGKRPAPKVIICKPLRGNKLDIREADSTFIQTISDESARELGRCLANTQYYEQAQSTRAKRKLPTALQWIGFQSGKLLSPNAIVERLSGFAVISKEEKSKAGFSFENYKSLLDSHAFSDNFWEDRILSCPTCTQKNILKGDFNLEKLIFHKFPGQYRISSSEFESAIASKRWICRKCNSQFNINEEPYRQSRWWSIKMNRPTGPEGAFVEQVPIYSLERLASNS